MSRFRDDEPEDDVPAEAEVEPEVEPEVPQPATYSPTPVDD